MPAATDTAAGVPDFQKPALQPNGANKTAFHSPNKISLQNISYPTNSLRFLEILGKQEPSSIPANAWNSHASSVSLDILVVGAGLGGLATGIALARKGHKVEVLEAAAQIGEVGAGIQIPPNSARLLQRWGVDKHLRDRVVEPEGITFRRWQTGSAIGYTKLIPNFQLKYDAPYYVVHRAHYHDALYQRALELGVQVKVNHRVISYDEVEPSIALQDGRKLSADLIVAADGIKSKAPRSLPNPEQGTPYLTGFAAYRAIVDASKMKEDPEVAWLLEKPALNIWIGEDRHVMTYTIASGDTFNMVLSHVDRSDPSKWRQETCVQDMRREFEGWDPQLVKVINMVEKTIKWPLMSGAPRDKWVSLSGKLVILGDAAHAMVPYMSQGAGMAIEDAAALAEALDHAETRANFRNALSLFEQVRTKRANQMQQASLVNGKIWHFPDGPEQEARDKGMEPEVLSQTFEYSPNQWSDPVTQEWAYGYDAELAIGAAAKSHGSCDIP